MQPYMLYPVFRPQKARVVFKFVSQSDGYWNNELFILHSSGKKAISIAKFKHPISNNTIVFYLIRVQTIVHMLMMR